MADVIAEALNELVMNSQERLGELREAGDAGVLIAAAQAAADAIERRVGRSLEGRGSLNETERQALGAVQRFTFNVAADCWPGWAIPAEPPDPRNLLAALELARRSVALVRKLELGPLRVGTGIWLCGAFELALGRRADAATAFTEARQHYVDAQAPGLSLLTEGYLAIVRGGDVEDVCAQIAAGGFQDGGEWVEQLRVAARVFAR